MRNSQIETLEISDNDLDTVAGGAAGLSLDSLPGGVAGSGGANLAGHGVDVTGGASLQDGAQLTVTGG